MDTSAGPGHYRWLPEAREPPQALRPHTHIHMYVRMYVLVLCVFVCVCVCVCVPVYAAISKNISSRKTTSQSSLIAHSITLIHSLSVVLYDNYLLPRNCKQTVKRKTTGLNIIIRMKQSRIGIRMHIPLTVHT